MPKYSSPEKQWFNCNGRWLLVLKISFLAMSSWVITPKYTQTQISSISITDLDHVTAYLSVFLRLIGHTFSSKRVKFHLVCKMFVWYTWIWYQSTNFRYTFLSFEVFSEPYQFSLFLNIKQIASSKNESLIFPSYFNRLPWNFSREEYMPWPTF